MAESENDTAPRQGAGRGAGTRGRVDATDGVPTIVGPSGGSLPINGRLNLEKLGGGQFDLAYVDGQVQDHQKTAQLLEREIGSGQDPARLARDSIASASD